MNAKSDRRRPRRRLLVTAVVVVTILGSSGVAAQMSSAQTPTTFATTTSAPTTERHCPMTTTPPPCVTTTTLPRVTTIPTTIPTTTPPARNPLCQYRSQIPAWLWRILVTLLDIRCAPPATTTTTTTTTTRPTSPTTRETTTTTGTTVQNCGSYNAATGWPTTTVHQPNQCLLGAFANGTPASLVVYTTTTATGTRLLKTTYEVIGVGLVRVTADPTRSSGSNIVVSHCTELADRGVVPSVGGCTEISSTPVTAPATQTSVVVTPSLTVPAGQPLTLAATVVTADGQPVPTGYVTLVDYQYPQGGMTLDADGHATLTISRQPGIYYFNVVYSGDDGRYRSSVSPAIRIEVTA